MKRTNLYLIGILSGLLFVMTSCNKDDELNPQQETSDTRTYTGVLIGSTGAYKLNLTKNGAEAFVLFNDEAYILTSSQTLENGQSLILSDGTASLTFEIDSEGNNPEIAFTIPGYAVQSTIVISYQTNPNQNYIGRTQSSYNDGTKFHETTFNITLYDGDKWTGLERVDLDIDPGNPNHQSTQGQITRVSGTYTEIDNVVNLAWSDSSKIYYLPRSGDDLLLVQGAGTEFIVSLTQVDL
jgi:hypothetical protein